MIICPEIKHILIYGIEVGVNDIVKSLYGGTEERKESLSKRCPGTSSMLILLINPATCILGPWTDSHGLVLCRRLPRIFHIEVQLIDLL